MSKKKYVYLHILLIAAMAIALTAAPVKSERPVYYGISAAYPQSAEIPASDLPFPLTTGQRTIALTLEIDQTGAVKNSVQDSSEDSSIAKYVLSSLAKMSFEPAQVKGTKVSSNLPIMVTVNPRFLKTTIDFPVDAESNINSGFLYFKALKLCGAVWPEILRFPSYFCDISRIDSLEYLPFAFLKVELDESGQVQSTEVVHTNLPAFSKQTQSAVLWAVFSPLKLGGKVTPCTCFVLISFFPQLFYPSNAIDVLKDTVNEWYDSWRVQLFPDTVGLMLPPLPRDAEIGDLSFTSKDGFFMGEVVANLTIDSSGYFKLHSIDAKNPPLHKALSDAVKKVRFYPALNFSGSAVSFRGSAKFFFGDRTSVRAEYFWLDAH